MKTRLLHLLELARATFWVLPAIIATIAVAGAFLLVGLDRNEADAGLVLVPWLSDIAPQVALGFLNTVAGSVLTLAAVTISGTLVALTLASSQFGPRLLRVFIQSNTTQFTLGILLATHLYCLVAIQGIRTDASAFVPDLTMAGAFLLSLLSLGFFIGFIHHVVNSIQAERVVAEVYRDLCGAIDRFFGEEGRTDDQEEAQREKEKEEWEELTDERVLRSAGSGYLQAVDIEGLVALAERHDLHCRMLVSPGDFLVPRMPLLAWDAPENLGEDITESFCRCFLIGDQRTAEQDLEYCSRQLVEIALRALSPGINDPFTAINCIDCLGGALVKVANKRLPKNTFHDEEGTARLRTRPQTFSSFLDAACNQIRQAAAEKPDVAIRFLEVLHDVGEQCPNESQLEGVLQQGELMAQVACAQASTTADEKAIQSRLEALQSLAA